MAKLSAYNRTCILTVVKEDHNPTSDLITWERKTVKLMSDNKVLEKRDVIFKPSPHLSSYIKTPDKHTWGWKVKGTKKTDLSADQFRDIYIKRGYTVK